MISLNFDGNKYYIFKPTSVIFIYLNQQVYESKKFDEFGIM